MSNEHHRTKKERLRALSMKPEYVFPLYHAKDRPAASEGTADKKALSPSERRAMWTAGIQELFAQLLGDNAPILNPTQYILGLMLNDGKGVQYLAAIGTLGEDEVLVQYHLRGGDEYRLGVIRHPRATPEEKPLVDLKIDAAQKAMVDEKLIELSKAAWGKPLFPGLPTFIDSPFNKE